MSFLYIFVLFPTTHMGEGGLIKIQYSLFSEEHLQNVNENVKNMICLRNINKLFQSDEEMIL